MDILCLGFLPDSIDAVSGFMEVKVAMFMFSASYQGIGFSHAVQINKAVLGADQAQLLQTPRILYRAPG